MINRILIITCAIILASSSMSFIFIQEKPINATHLACLKNKNYLDQAIIYGDLDFTDKSLTPSVPFQQLNKLSIQPQIIIDVNQQGIPPYPTVVVKMLSKANYKILWLSIFTEGFKTDCKSFFKFTVELKTLIKKEIGILTNGQQWIQQFNDKNACSQFGIFPLFYNGAKQFDSFGGWNNYLLTFGKQLDGLCQIKQLQQVLSSKVQSKVQSI